MGINISELIELTSSQYTLLNNIIPVFDENENSVVDQNKKLSFFKLYKNLSNNLVNLNDNRNLNYFGSGKDGDLILSSSVQTSSSFSSSYNGDFLIKQFKNFTINSNTTCSVTNPCRGLIIFCTGDCLISGLLTMTAKGGGVSTSTDTFWSSSVTNINSSLYSLYVNTSSVSPIYWAKTGSIWFNKYKTEIGLKGLAFGGNQTLYPSTGSNGQAGIFSCGGGGSGGNTLISGYQSGAFGASGSLFCGGGGGAGASRYSISSSAYPNFENGGNSISFAGAGAGNPKGVNLASNSACDSTFGVGGLLILIVRGNLTLQITGSITSNGSNGGAGATSWMAGGGGSGGGRVIILYGGTFNNSGSITVNGGVGGTVTNDLATPGGNGGVGAITVLKISQ